jgi:Spy/CpxP family protein refolding chaperone
MSESPVKNRSRPFLRATLIAVPLALLLSAGFLHAQHAIHHGDHSPATQVISLDHVHAMLARVGVSSSQQLRIDGFLEAANSQMQAVHQGLDDAHRELAGLLLAPTVDRGQLEALRARQVAALDAASSQMLAAIEAAVRELTPEQRAALLDLHKPRG